MAGKIVSYVLRGEITQFGASMKAASASVGKLANDLTGLDAKGAKMRAGLTTVGDAAGKMGLAAAAGVGLVVKSAMDWESAWAGVQKTVNGSASEMAVLEGELRQLAKTLPASHTEIAAVAEAAGQLGIQRENVASFTRTMVDLGETTNLSANEAATSIARFTNIMGTSADEVSNIGSAIVELGNNSATTEAEIMVFGTRLAAAGAIAGLTEGEVLGFGAALSSVGVEAEAGGTALSKVFTSMRDAAIDGGDKLEVFAQTAGMTAQEFTTAWSQDPADVINSFVMGLGSINEAGQSTSAVFKSLGLTDQRLMKALLSAAEAGDLLGDSLDMGNTGFEQNTALAIEAAKRYETTASQVQVSWNNVKDAAIDFGESALPVLAAGAEKMATFAQAVGKLPQPVKSATTGLLGVTAVLGGSLWFGAKAIAGVSSMRGALENLGMSGDKASTSMKNVGKAAGALAALTAIGGVIDGIRGSFESALPGMEEFTRQLLALETTQALGSEFDGLSEALNGVDTATGRVTTSVGGMLSGLGPLGTGVAAVGDALAGNFNNGLLNSMDSVEEFGAQIGLIDRAFANLASSGGADLAAETFLQFAASANLSKDAQDALLAKMPQYKDALAGIENAATMAADATGDAAGPAAAYGGALEGLGDSAEDTADQLNDLIDAMRDQRSEALRSANAEINYQAALDDTRKALKENGKTVDISTKKGRANMSALYDQAAAFNDLNSEAKNAPGAHRGAIKSFVDMAVKMGMGKKAAQELAREIIEIPDKRIKIEADTSQAMGAIGATRAALDALRDKRVIVTTEQHTINRSPVAIARAEGGAIFGPGTGTSDDVPIMASNGEHMWTAAEVAAAGGHEAMYRLRQLVAAGGLQGFAAGGAIGHYATGGKVSGSADHRLAITRALQEIADIRRELAKSGKEALNGRERRITQLELKAAQRDLRETRNAPRKARQAKARERRENIGQAWDGFDLGNVLPRDEPTNPLVLAVREELNTLKEGIKAAGGTWTKGMRRWAREVVSGTRKMEREMGVRDRLQESLEGQVRALDELRSTMSAFSAQVAGNFTADPFNLNIAAPDPGPGPESAASRTARAGLASAEGRYAAVAGGTGGDPLERSYLASKLLAEVDQYRAQVDELDQARESAGGMASAVNATLDPLTAFEQTLTTATASALSFTADMKALAALGLDGPLFEKLAASGDTGLASALLGSGAAGVDRYEDMFEANIEAAGQAGAFATQEVYGRQFEAQMASNAALEKQLAASNKIIEKQSRIIENTAARSDRVAERVGENLGQRVDGLRQAVASIPRQQQEIKRNGKRGRG